MPLTGTDAELAASMKAAIEAKMTAALGVSPNEAPWLLALCEGIAESLIPHLVSNIQVEAGQNVALGSTVCAAPGAPLGGVALTDTPTVIT